MDLKDKLKKYLDSYLKPSKARFGSVLGETFEEATLDRSVESYINDNKDDVTFQTKLFEYIDNANLKDSDVYNKVFIDRRLFSKIRSDKNYHPSKETVILFGISLELTEEELEDLLSRASYFLSRNNTFDLIIRFCFKEKIYDLNKINEFLYSYNCKTLN